MTVLNPPVEMHRGHLRMAERFVHQQDGRLRYAHGIGWYLWDGARFAPDQDGAAMRAAIDVVKAACADLAHLPKDERDQLYSDIGKVESANGLDGMLRIASALKPIAVAAGQLDADPYLLNVADGTLDLRTMELRPHDPADQITKVTRARYDRDATDTEWSKFIGRVLPDEPVRGFVQRVTGVGLLGKVVEHLLPILTGEGANGKSVFCRALGHALGDYAGTAEPELFMHRDGAHPTGEMDLRGLRWVVVSESDKDRRLAEATMKRLTGGDIIRARRMRQDFVEFQPSHTAVLVTNHLPRVSGDDPAIWRRLRVVPFTVTIPEAERDPHLDERLQLEADAILTWAVAGYREYAERGMDEPESVRAATDRYQADSDAVGRFIADSCQVHAHASATTSQLYREFERWARAEGVDEIGQREFGQVLDRKGYRTRRATGGTRLRRGIGLPTEDDERGDE